MVKIYLVQHGKSHPKEVDPDRRLTDEGIKETERVGGYLSSIGIKVDELWHSTKLRAEMTGHILAEYLNIGGIKRRDGLAPLDDPNPVADELRNIDRDVMIVGHLPFLSKLTSILLNVDTEVVEFTYSGVVCLERGGDGKFRLKWYMMPDIIR